MPHAAPRGASWHTYAIVAMLVAFLLVVWQRDRIRAHWWVTRLGLADDLQDHALYVARLVGVGDKATGAIDRLASNQNPNIALLAVPASSGLSEDPRADLLKRLLHYDDLEVRHIAATALAFMNSPTSRAHLTLVALADNEQAATAASAGLARLADPDTLSALCQAMRHRSTLVRAQAVESLGQRVRIAGTTESSDAHAIICDPVEAIVRALDDDSAFVGSLALEREIAAVSAAVIAREQAHDSSMMPSDGDTETVGRRRSVAEVASTVLSDLTGREIDTPRPMDELQRRQFIEQCRTWIAERELLPIPDDVIDPES